MHRSAEEEEAALELCALGIQSHQQRLRLRRVTLQNLDLSVINKLLSKRSSAISHWVKKRTLLTRLSHQSSASASSTSSSFSRTIPGKQGHNRRPLSRATAWFVRVANPRRTRVAHQCTQVCQGVMLCVSKSPRAGWHTRAPQEQQRSRLRGEAGRQLLRRTLCRDTKQRAGGQPGGEPSDCERWSPRRPRHHSAVPTAPSPFAQHAHACPNRSRESRPRAETPTSWLGSPEPRVLG